MDAIAVVMISPLPFAVGCEDVILGGHSGMARETAVHDASRIGLERVRCRLIVKRRVGPSLRIRVFLGVLLDEENVLQDVGYSHRERSFRIFFRFPFDLCNLGTIGERLAVAGDTGTVGIDHRWISDHYLEQVFGLTNGNNLPILVAAEVGKCEAVRHAQSVLILRGKGRYAQSCHGDSQYGSGSETEVARRPKRFNSHVSMEATEWPCPNH